MDVKWSPFTYTINGYLQQLGSSAPTPGGGSTSAVVASLGAAIAVMAGRVSDRSDTQKEIQDLIQRLLSFRERFEHLCQADIDSFLQVMTDLNNKEDEEHLQYSIEQAASVPLQLAKDCIDAMLLCEELLSQIKDNVLSDLGCAVLFLHAACQGAWLTMSINSRYLTDLDQIRRFGTEGQKIRNDSSAKCKEILCLVEARMNLMN